MAQPTVWPEGVIARFLTRNGATVDLTGNRDAADGICTGCLAIYDDTSPLYYGLIAVRRWAQDHAEKCLALPRPTADIERTCSDELE